MTKKEIRRLVDEAFEAGDDWFGEGKNEHYEFSSEDAKEAVVKLIMKLIKK